MISWIFSGGPPLTKNQRNQASERGSDFSSYFILTSEEDLLTKSETIVSKMREVTFQGTTRRKG